MEYVLRNCFIWEWLVESYIMNKENIDMMAEVLNSLNSTLQKFKYLPNKTTTTILYNIQLYKSY